MDYARKEPGSQIVSAVEDIGNALLFCPICGLEVFRRAGLNRKPHFAHRNGTTKPECELYHPSTNSPEFFQSQFQQTRKSLSLYLKREGGSESKKWFLALRIPRCNDPHGQLQVQGPTGLRRVPLKELFDKPIRLPVKLGEERYFVQTQGVNDVAWLEAIKEGVSGLSKAKPNIFKYSENGGRLLAPNIPLFWGRLYSVVWDSGKAITFPKDVDYIQLEKQLNWSAAIFELPDPELLSQDEKSSIETWAATNFEKVVEQAPVRLFVSSPIVEYDEDENTFFVLPKTNVVLSIDGERGSKRPTALLIRHKGGQSQFPCAGDLPCLFSVENPPGHFEGYLSGVAVEPIQVVFVEATSRELPQVEFIFCTRINTHSASVPAHSDKIYRALDGVARGETSIAKVSIPMKVKVTISEESMSGTIATIFKGESDVASYECPAFVEKILDLLSTGTNFRLGFGHFGIVHFGRKRRKNQQSRHLPRDLEKRLRWILTFTSKGGGPRVKSPSPLLAEVLSPASLRLVEEFYGISSVPIPLIVHEQSTKVQLDTFLKSILEKEVK